MRTRSALQALALVGAGVGCGLLLASFRRVEPPQRPEELAAEATPGGAPSAADRPRLLPTAALAAIASAAGAPPKDHIPSDDPHVDEPSADERVRAARAEPVDERWAEGASRLMQADLADASARAGFRYSRLECRSTTCVVELDWPSRRAAQDAAKSALPRELHRTQCEQRLLFPDAAPAGGRARSYLILRCNTPAAVAAMRLDTSNGSTSNTNRL